jgi:hypothetical protein
MHRTHSSDPHMCSQCYETLMRMRNGWAGAFAAALVSLLLDRSAWDAQRARSVHHAAAHLGAPRLHRQLRRALSEMRGELDLAWSDQGQLENAYTVRRFTTGRLTDETHWFPNKEMTKISEVSDETSTNLFPHLQCQTLQCDTSTLKPRPGGAGPVA